MTFKDKIQRLERFAHQVELDVLVWGPGAGAPQDNAKRQKIRDSISAQFPVAEVRFSEELVASAGDLANGLDTLPLPEQELWHLAASDVCVVLDTSKGSGEEIAHFSGTPHCCKLLVFTHEQYSNANSFPAELRKKVEQRFYTDEEYESCNLVAKVLKHIETIALGKLSSHPV